MLDSNWKKFSSKVKVYLSDSQVFESTGIDKVLQVDLKEELANSNTNPLGVVSANTINLKLLDEDKRFVKNNKQSPYYGLINEGIKIEYFISVDDGVFEPAGIYFATDIKNNAVNGSYSTVNINGADIIQYIGNTPVNIIGIQRNITVKQYLEVIFQSVGLTSSQYNIDDSINKVLKYTYTLGVKLKDILNSIAQSYMCNIYVDREGVIQVVDLLELAKKNDKQFEFDGVINTFQTSLGTDLLDTYNSIRVNYSNPTLIRNDRLLSIDNIDIPAGTSELSEFTYVDNKKALGISYINIQAEDIDTTISINGVSATQNSIILKVTNPKENIVRGKIEVVGPSVNENSSVVERFISGVEVDRRKFIDVKAPLIQTDSYAIEYCNVILKYLSSDTSYVSLKTKGHPLLRLTDIVGVKSDLLEFEGTCIVSSIRLSLGSSYSCSINVLNSKALQ